MTAVSRAALDHAAATADVWPPILAVDPGTQSTGVCLRAGVEAIEAVTVEFGGDPTSAMAPTDYAAEVLAAGCLIVDRRTDDLAALARERGATGQPVRYAVEVMVPPTPAAGAKGRRVAVAPRVLRSLPIACTVLGAVRGHWRDAIRVPPRGGAHGGWEALPATYPSRLRGRTPPGWLAGGVDRSHQRSAWAIAGAAHLLDIARRNADQVLAAEVQAVVLAVLALRPDPARAESVLAATREAIQTARAERLVGREPQVAAAAARGLGVDPGVLRTAVEAAMHEEAA